MAQHRRADALLVNECNQFLNLAKEGVLGGVVVARAPEVREVPGSIPGADLFSSLF